MSRNDLCVYVIQSYDDNGCLFYWHFTVNYRGSLAFGQDSVLSLPGNVGKQDVKDVQVNFTF